MEQDFIYSINSLLNQIDKKKSCNQIDLENFDQVLENSNSIQNENRSKIIDYLLIKLKCRIISKIPNYCPEFKEFSSPFDFMVTVESLIILIKSKSIKNVYLEFSKEIFKYSKENSVFELKALLFLKSILKNINTFEDDQFLNLTIDFLKCIDFSSIKNTTNTSIYKLLKYFRCISLLIEKFPNLYLFMQNILKILINFETPSELKIKHLILILKIIIYLKDQAGEIQGLNELFFNQGNFQFDLIYSGQDDDTFIDFNLMCLKEECSIEAKVSFLQDLFKFYLNSHVLFAKLCSSVSFDYQILLDWLISNETNFLIYFLKYLKYLLAELTNFQMNNLNLIFNSNPNNSKIVYFNQVTKSQLKLENYLTKTLELLAKLQIKIQKLKKSFPYNCEPLIKLLEKINKLLQQF